MDVKRLLTATMAAVLWTTLLGSAGCVSRDGAPSGSGHQAAWKHIELAILEDYDKGEDLALVERDFRLFRELGIHTWRGSLGWDDYEPSRGRFDFPWLEEFARRAERQGITLRPYLAYTPEWAASKKRADAQAWNDPPARLDDWRRFVAALARAMSRHANVASYEIYNEENVTEWWEGSAEDYAAVLRAGAQAIRSADPDAQVVLGGMVWPDAGWLERICRSAPRSFDVVAFHAYPETWTPDSIRVENYLGRRYGALLDELDECGPRPVWINETGFATAAGKSEEDQAAWWARALATFAAAPRVTQIGVYEIKDLRPGRDAIGGAENYHLGLMTSDRRKKLAFHTVGFFARFFDADSVQVDDEGVTVLRRGVPAGSGAASAGRSEVHRHLFRRPDGRQLAVIWTGGGDPVEVDLVFTRTARRAASHTLRGTGFPVGEFDGRRILRWRLAPGDVTILTLTP